MCCCCRAVQCTKPSVCWVSKEAQWMEYSPAHQQLRGWQEVYNTFITFLAAPCSYSPVLERTIFLSLCNYTVGLLILKIYPVVEEKKRSFSVNSAVTHPQRLLSARSPALWHQVFDFCTWFVDFESPHVISPLQSFRTTAVTGERRCNVALKNNTHGVLFAPSHLLSLLFWIYSLLYPLLVVAYIKPSNCMQ